MKRISLLKAFTLLPAILLTGVSCENDLDLQTPETKVIPVIYSVLELSRDTLIVRVTRTFAGSGSAIESAQVEDSVYFHQASVRIERWNNGFLAGRAEMTPYEGKDRLPGIFLTQPNRQFILVKTVENVPIFEGNFEYHLSVEIPGQPTVGAVTKAFKPAKLVSPAKTGNINLFLDPFVFEWNPWAPFSDLYFRLFYQDIYADTTAERVISWRESHSTEKSQPTSKSIFGQDFMKRIAGQVHPDSRVLYRRAGTLQVIVVAIPSDLFEFRRQILVLPPDEIGFPVTNVVNGIGLFTSQTITAFDLFPDPKSQDSIMYGQYTRHLNFRYY